jgi:hypothetical protein
VREDSHFLFNIMTRNNLAVKALGFTLTTVVKFFCSETNEFALSGAVLMTTHPVLMTTHPVLMTTHPVLMTTHRVIATWILTRPW